MAQETCRGGVSVCVYAHRLVLFTPLGRWISLLTQVGAIRAVQRELGPRQPSAAGMLSRERLESLRAEADASAVDIPPWAVAWTEQEARLFFSSGGMEVPQLDAPTSAGEACSCVEADGLLTPPMPRRAHASTRACLDARRGEPECGSKDRALPTSELLGRAGRVRADASREELDAPEARGPTVRSRVEAHS